MSQAFARCLALAGVAAVLALGGAAQAQTITATVIGRIGGYAGPSSSPNNGDALGLFGRKGRDLTGRLMSVTFTFDASAMFRGGAVTDTSSAWTGDTGSVVVKVGSRPASPAIGQVGKLGNTRVHLYSDDQGEWADYQFAESQPGGGRATVGLSVLSPIHPFVPGNTLTETSSYSPAPAGRKGQSVSLDVTVGGVREYLTADVLSISYGP